MSYQWLGEVVRLASAHKMEYLNVTLRPLYNDRTITLTFPKGALDFQQGMILEMDMKIYLPCEKKESAG